MRQRLFGDDIQADAFDTGSRPGEVVLDDALIEADGFKHLRAAIALQGGNPHLRERLQQSLVDRFDKIRDRFWPERFVRAGFRATVSSARYGFTALAP